MAYIQYSTAYRTVYLTLADTPATGVAHSAVAVMYKKSGQAVWTTKTLTLSDWSELGGGMYSIRFSASEMNTTGDFTFTLNGPAFDNFVYDEFTIEPSLAGFIPQPTIPSQCVVSGFVAGSNGLPPSMIKIVARPVQLPARHGNMIVTGDVVWTFADAYGNFSLPLIRGSTVLIQIERTGVRAQITVPDAPAANLLDLLPPISIDYSL